ncbi:MFS transporter [Dactylosporangium sp. CA-092794]|uniref:MFS transporter n=1 Tax=Dactylosporangium sp. CA-092794 TaxID=3239929 RepID=UPI003D939D20
MLPGLAVSALGDGMSLVAVGWLALQLAPGGSRGAWVAAAVAAYSLPSALGGVLFGRYLKDRSGAQLAGWNAVLRAACLGAVTVAYVAGFLQIGLYVVLLALSSLLAAWGSAGRYTLIAELLPQEHHLAANSLMTAIGEFATIVGPPLAGVLIGWSNAAAVIALDAASFAVLAATYRLAMPKLSSTPLNNDKSGKSGHRVSGLSGTKATAARTTTSQAGPASTTAGPASTTASPAGTTADAESTTADADSAAANAVSTAAAEADAVAQTQDEAEATSEAQAEAAATRRALIGLSVVFFLLFGPFYVALPIYVADELHASATVLGLYLTAFGVGAVAGGIATGYLRRLPLWPTVVGIVIAFGAALLPLGLGAPAAVALPAFAVGGLCWAPYLPTVMALFQRTTPAGRLPRVLATFGSMTVIAVPLGTAIGGPLVTAFGARPTLLGCAIGTIALGVVGASVMIWGYFGGTREKTHPAGYIQR